MNHAIIVSAGTGTRMNSSINKVLLCIDDKPVIFHAIKPFEDCKDIHEAIVVCNENDIDTIREIVDKNNFKKVKKIVEGGKERQDSVYNGILALDADDEDIIIIHNGANPLVNSGLIKEIINAVEENGSAVCGFPAVNTIKESDKDGFVRKTIYRGALWEIQTPQAAKYAILKKAFDKAYEANFYGTDDAGLIEHAGYKVKIVKCDKDNFKITTNYDLEQARLIKNSIKVGIGMDSHRFSNASKPLILGGVEIPNEQGLSANSDGDVILHALTNALSSSIGGRSLGFYADPLCKEGITDSKEYIKLILNQVKEKGYLVSNVGITIEAKRPRLDSYEEKIKSSIATILGMDSADVGINVTSGEDLTEFARGNGIQVFAVVGLRRK